MFDGILWVRSDDAPKLRDLIKTEFYEDLLHLSMKYSQLANSSATDSPYKDHYLNLSTQFGESAKSLRNIGFKKGILEEAGETFFLETPRKGGTI